MKKVFVLLILVLLLGNVVFAQEKTANVRNNWISGEISIIGAGARYERMLNSNFSIGAAAYFSYTFFIIKDTGVDVSARWYPWGKTFYLGLGVGFHMVTLSTLIFDSNSGLIGGAITPEVGWKIDTGSPGGFFIQPGIKVPITLGGWNDSTGGFGVYAFPILYFGLGGAF